MGQFLAQCKTTGMSESADLDPKLQFLAEKLWALKRKGQDPLKWRRLGYLVHKLCWDVA